METADYTVLQAKRMMGVINLIRANGKMAHVCVYVCVALCCVKEHEGCLCVFVMCACVLYLPTCIVCARVCVGVCVYFLLVNASSAHGRGSA